MQQVLLLLLSFQLVLGLVLVQRQRDPLPGRLWWQAQPQSRLLLLLLEHQRDQQQLLGRLQGQHQNQPVLLPGRWLELEPQSQPVLLPQVQVLVHPL
jgi:hypothetical protein